MAIDGGRTKPADAMFYPDVFVTCDPHDRVAGSELFKQHPSLVVEILSPSTAAFDRGRKFDRYQQVDSLQEYLLIEQERLHADLFRKNSDGLWGLHPAPKRSGSRGVHRGRRARACYVYSRAARCNAGSKAARSRTTMAARGSGASSFFLRNVRPGKNPFHAFR
ncbi:MAG: Uma2 family endonuclease [Azonexus sp.]